MSDGLTTAVHPAASSGASFQVRQGQWRVPRDDGSHDPDGLALGVHQEVGRRAGKLLAADLVGHPGEEVVVALQAFGLGRSLADDLAVVSGLDLRPTAQRRGSAARPGGASTGLARRRPWWPRALRLNARRAARTASSTAAGSSATSAQGSPVERVGRGHAPAVGRGSEPPVDPVVVYLHQDTPSTMEMALPGQRSTTTSARSRGKSPSLITEEMTMSSSNSNTSGSSISHIPPPMHSS